MPGASLAGQWRGVTVRVARAGRRMPLLHVALSSAVALVLQVALLGAVLPASQAHDGDHSADPATVLKPALRGLVVTQPRTPAWEWAPATWSSPPSSPSTTRSAARSTTSCSPTARTRARHPSSTTRHRRRSPVRRTSARRSRRRRAPGRPNPTKSPTSGSATAGPSRRPPRRRTSWAGTTPAAGSPCGSRRTTRTTSPARRPAASCASRRSRPAPGPGCRRNGPARAARGSWSS